LLFGLVMGWHCCYLDQVLACPLSWLVAVSVVLRDGGVVEMPSAYANEEYAEAHFVYGFSDGNMKPAVVEYRQRYTEL
jgi:hypothetical protein